MVSFTSTKKLFYASYCVDSGKQYPLFRLLQKRSKELDSGGFIGTILMELSKAYDCLRHDLLMIKLEAFGLENGTPNLFWITSVLRNNELNLVLLIMNG